MISMFFCCYNLFVIREQFSKIYTHLQPKWYDSGLVWLFGLMTYEPYEGHLMPNPVFIYIYI